MKHISCTNECKLSTRNDITVEIEDRYIMIWRLQQFYNLYECISCHEEADTERTGNAPESSHRLL